MEDLYSLDAWELADLIRAAELKAVELLDVCLERIGRFDDKLNSFVLIDPEGAREAAEAVDKSVAQGKDPGTLAGIPIGVKDLHDAAGLPTGYGSLLLRTEPLKTDSTHVARLRTCGAVVLGKTTTPELGTLNYTVSKATGVTRNPWNLERTPGGSSGGSAAAVSSGMVPLATGSDGGGSIRIPSSFCGLPGLKPTYGLIPRGPGRVGTANMSCLGPIARSVRDIARYVDATSGAAPMDPFSLPKSQTSLEASLEVPLEGIRVTFSSDLGFGVCDPEIEEISRAAASKLEAAAGMAAIDRKVVLPDIGMAWMLAEAIDCYSDLEHLWPDHAEEMTVVVGLAMQLAQELQPTQMSEASRGRYELLRSVNEVFDDVDLIFTPATTTSAFAADGPLPHSIAGTVLNNPLQGICFTYPFNLTGHPAVSIPAGLTSEGLPVGLQVVGPRLSEATLLSVAYLWEQVSPWPKLAPAYS